MEFSFTPSTSDWLHIVPELVTGGAALVVLLVDLILPAARRAWLAAVALLGIVGAGVAVGYLLATGVSGEAFFHMVTADGTAVFAAAVVLLAGGLAVLLSPGYIERQGITHQGEYYALLLLATTGMMLMAAATNLMTIFVGLELLSLCLYILSAFIANRPTSHEAGMKYFLLSSFASGFLLYGMALTYGATGATSLTGIRAFVDAHPFTPASGYGPLLLAALALLAVGFCFKVSAIPFHAWTPDVYVGAPTSVTAFMSVGTKVAAFVALARTFVVALHPAHATWVPLLWAVAVVTMIGGNLLAVTQSDVKRLLAYSSVAHAGYILVGVVTSTVLGIAGMLIYLATYAAMNVGAFGVVLALERRDGQGTTLADYAGLARRRPWLAGALLVCLLALAGVPPSAGFVGKWAVFYAAIVGGHAELAIIGVVASVFGMFYYLRVIWAMYFAEPVAMAVAPSVAPVDVDAAALRTVSVAAPTGEQGTAVALAEPVAEPAPASTTTAYTATPTSARDASSPRVPFAADVALTVAVVLTLLLGIVPGPLFDAAMRAATSLLH
jgi:NADH-quinone oxidoreductase subunit N